MGPLKCFKENGTFKFLFLKKITLATMFGMDLESFAFSLFLFSSIRG